MRRGARRRRQHRGGGPRQPQGQGVRRERQLATVDRRERVQDAQPRGVPASVAPHPRQRREARSRAVVRRRRGRRVRRPRAASAGRAGAGRQRRRAGDRVDVVVGGGVRRGGHATAQLSHGVRGGRLRGGVAQRQRGRHRLEAARRQDLRRRRQLRAPVRRRSGPGRRPARSPVRRLLRPVRPHHRQRHVEQPDRDAGRRRTLHQHAHVQGRRHRVAAGGRRRRSRTTYHCRTARTRQDLPVHGMKSSDSPTHDHRPAAAGVHVDC